MVTIYEVKEGGIASPSSSIRYFYFDTQEQAEVFINDAVTACLSNDEEGRNEDYRNCYEIKQVEIDYNWQLPENSSNGYESFEDYILSESLYYNDYSE